MRVTRNGMVAVLVSPGFGAGWSTWNSEHRDLLLFDPEIVQAVLDGDKKRAATLAKEKTNGDVYTGGADDLEVQWVPQGAVFEIHEYDGSESLQMRDREGWVVA